MLCCTILFGVIVRLYLVLHSMETITLGDKRIGIKTSVLEEKATACNMLCCYADELKEGFFPWIDQVCFNSSYWVIILDFIAIRH